VPLSRGNATIFRASVSDKPVIDLGWVIDPADAEVAVTAFKRCRQAWASSVLELVKVGPEVEPGPSGMSDADIPKYSRQQAQNHLAREVDVPYGKRATAIRRPTPRQECLASMGCVSWMVRLLPSRCPEIPMPLCICFPVISKGWAEW
jgi:hypothetical protein